MSNSKRNKEQDQPFVQTKQQASPGEARPEDFEVLSGQAAELQLPFHGQCGDSLREYRALEQERKVDAPVTGKGLVKKRKEPRDAELPHTKLGEEPVPAHQTDVKQGKQPVAMPVEDKKGKSLRGRK